MFESVGWGEILVLVLAGLFILGPERLPEAAAWLGKNVRKAREFATGARQQIRNEMGSDFDQYRQPLADLRNLRNLDPKRAIAQHLFDGDTDPLGLKKEPTGGLGSKPVGLLDSSGHLTNAATSSTDSLKPGQKAPIDSEAT